MAVFVPAYLRVLSLFQEWGKGKRELIQQQIDFFGALEEDAKARLEVGEYPPYHFVRAGTCKNWLQAFLYWRSKSLGLGKARDNSQQ
jgi:hypothetical protein